jgi:hypothetical protein
MALIQNQQVLLTKQPIRNRMHQIRKKDQWNEKAGNIQ